MTASFSQGLVLAVHPTSRGFGWVVFEGPSAPVDWGIATAKANRNVRLANRFARLLKRYDPAVLVLEQFEGDGLKRAARIQALCVELIRATAGRSMGAVIYHRFQINAALGLPERTTRHQVTAAVKSRLDAFSHRMPPKRKPWVAEDPRQSLFNAAALALTFYALMGEE